MAANLERHLQCPWRQPYLNSHVSVLGDAMLGSRPQIRTDFRMSSPYHRESPAHRTSLPEVLQRLPQSAPRTEDSASAGCTADRILSLLTSSAYRKGSLEQMRFSECGSSMLTCVEKCVRKRNPVQLTLMAFPFKVPNPAKVGPRQLPDLAELIAILRLQRLNARIKAFYRPGLQVHIIHDGSYICDIFGVSLDEVRQYEHYFGFLVRAVGAEDFIRTHDFMDLFGCRIAEIEPRLSYLWGRSRHWCQSKRGTPEWTSRFAKTLGMINLRKLSVAAASRLTALAACGELPAEYAEFELRARQAMLRYYLRDYLLHAFDPRPQWFADAIHATTQERPQRLALWLVQRGRSLLPWHGVGIIDERGEPSVVPAVQVIGNSSFQEIFVGEQNTPFLYLHKNN